jgi:hypothetical protein
MSGNVANLVIDKDLGTNRVPYATFKALTDTRGMTTKDWCSTCNGTTWDPVNAPASCVRILLADAQASEASDDDDSKESQLRGAVAGLAVVLSVALVGLGVLLFQRRKRNQSKVGLLSNDNDSLTV